MKCVFYFVCVLSLFIYGSWNLITVILQIWRFLYIFLSDVFAFKINIEDCSLWQMQALLKTISSDYFLVYFIIMQ